MITLNGRPTATLHNIKTGTRIEIKKKTVQRTTTKHHMAMKNRHVTLSQTTLHFCVKFPTCHSYKSIIHKPNKNSPIPKTAKSETSLKKKTIQRKTKRTKTKAVIFRKPFAPSIILGFMMDKRWLIPRTGNSPAPSQRTLLWLAADIRSGGERKKIKRKREKRQWREWFSAERETGVKKGWGEERLTWLNGGIELISRWQRKIEREREG